MFSNILVSEKSSADFIISVWTMSAKNTKKINFAEENNNRDAGRKFNVDESQVRRWILSKNLSNVAE